MKRLARLVLLLLLVYASPDGRAQPGHDDAGFLSDYPSVERVRADFAARADAAPAWEIDARTAGRVRLLAETLEETWSGPPGGASFEEVAPAGARRLHESYMREFERIYASKRPPPQRECNGRSIAEQQAMGTCALVNFFDTIGRYHQGAEETRETAALYFAPSYHDRFIHLSPGRQQEAAEARQAEEARQAQARAADEADRTRWKWLNALTMAAVVGVFSAALFVAGVLLLRKAFRLHHEASVYEFENTTDGGVVQFADHASAVRHRNRKDFAPRLISLALVLLLAGSGGLFVAFLVATTGSF